MKWQHVFRCRNTKKSNVDVRGSFSLSLESHLPRVFGYSMNNTMAWNLLISGSQNERHLFSTEDPFEMGISCFRQRFGSLMVGIGIYLFVTYSSDEKSTLGAVFEVNWSEVKTFGEILKIFEDKFFNSFFSQKWLFFGDLKFFTFCVRFCQLSCLVLSPFVFVFVAS